MTWCPTTPREHVEKRKLEYRQFALVSAFLERSEQSKLVTHGSEAWTGRPRGHRASTGRFWPFLAVSRAQRPENDQKRQETAIPAFQRSACVFPRRAALLRSVALWWFWLVPRLDVRLAGASGPHPWALPSGARRPAILRVPRAELCAGQQPHISFSRRPGHSCTFPAPQNLPSRNLR